MIHDNKIVDFQSQNNWYIHQFSIFLDADFIIRFSSMRASKWAIHHLILIRVDEFDWNFYKVFDEVIIFYKNLIHFSDNNKFVSKIWSTTSILNIIEWWIAYFEALIKLNLVIKSVFKNIENWWIYQLFCDWKSIILSSWIMLLRKNKIASHCYY